jgi:hypothetical protein
MSQSQIKRHNRFIRRLHRKSYEATIESMAAGDARARVIQSHLKPKPRWMPGFLWGKFQRMILELPDNQPQP